MFLLTSTTSKFQVITSAAGKVDVHTSYADLTTGVVTPGAQNTSITTATTTDITPAITGTTVRNVENIKVSNNHASVTNTVTLQHTDGTTVVPVEQITLAPGWRFGYEEGTGIRVFDAGGREQVAQSSQPSGAAATSDIVANAANTYLVGLPIGGRVQPGSFFKWRLRASKTAAGTAAPTIAVVVGTAASTADTARVTHTGAVQTGVVDTGVFEIDAIVRAVGAGTSVIESICSLAVHSAAANAGFGAMNALSGVSTTFTIGASDYLGLTVNPGSLGVWTFQHALVDSGNLIA